MRRPEDAKKVAMQDRVDWAFALAGLLATALIPAFTRFDPTDPGATTAAGEVMWAAVYLFAVIRLLTLRKDAAALMRRSVLLWALLALMVASSLWSINNVLSLRTSFELTGTTIFALLLVLRYPLRRLLELLGLASAVIAYSSAFLIIFSPGRGRADWGAGEWCGLFQDKNNLGAAMVIALITLVPLLFYGSTRRRLAVGVTVALCALLLVGSQSATALAAIILAGAVSLLAWLWWAPKARPLGRTVVVVGGAVAIVSTLIFGLNTDAAIAMFGRTSNMSGRTDFWPYIVSAISDRPFGYGYRAFFRSPIGDSYFSYYSVEASFTPYHAHNSYLQAGLDGGVLAALILLGVVAIGLVRAIRYLSVRGTIVAAWPLLIIAYLGLGSFTETYLANANTLEWIAFVAALLYPVREAAIGATVTTEGRPC